MELFREIAVPILTLFVGGGATWFWGNYKTQKQAKQNDLDSFSSSIAQLTESINKLTVQNGELVAKLCEEQDRTLKIMAERDVLLQERGELLEQMDALQKKVASLTRKINKLLGNEKDSDS